MIGVFDSGYGGLTVFKALSEKFPEYDFIYFGDNARAPYGSRSPETIYEYTEEAVDWLFREGCELIILACNTASATALRRIQQEYLPANFPQKRVLGVLIPVAEAIAKENSGDKIGILATKATVESGAYLRELKNNIKHRVFNIVQQPTPLLVPLIEEGWAEHPIMREVLKKYLEPLKKEGIQNLILGCTHYPFIKHLIQEEMSGVKIFDSPSVIPASLENYLLRHHEIEKRLPRSGKRRYLTTDDPKAFSVFAKSHLNLHIDPEKVSL